MITGLDLDKLYTEARDAISARDYERASLLLKRILAIDEDYEDASRLLARIVKQQRKRWFNDLRLWGTLGAVLLVSLGVYFIPRLQTLIEGQSPVLTITPEWKSQSLASRISPTSTSQPETIVIPTEIEVSSPTSIPLTWKRIYTGQEFARDIITAIVVNPADPDVLYVGTSNAGIYKSIDGGLSWQPMHRGLGQASVSSLIIDPQNPRILYAAIPMMGVYKTTDGGENWTVSNQGVMSPGMNNALVMDPGDPQRLFYTDGEGHLYESSDAGSDWSSIKTSKCPDHIEILVVHPTLNETLFSSNAWSSEDCPAVLYKSVNGGSTWTKAAAEIIEVQDITIDDQDGRLLFIAGADAFRSTDGGESWTFLPIGCSRIRINPHNPLEVYCAVWGGEHPSDPGKIMKSADGGQTWETVLQLKIGWTQSIAFSTHDPRAVFIGSGGFHISTDAGETWVERSDGLAGTRLNLQLDSNNPSMVYAEDYNCGLYRSSDQGTHWEPISEQGCGLAIDADGSTIYRMSADRLFRSQDQGFTWEVLASPRILGPYVQVFTHRRQPWMLYAIYWEGTDYISRDRGETWQAADMAIGDARLFFDLKQGQTVYAIGGRDPAYRSVDDGQTWQGCGATNSLISPTEGMGAGSALAIDPRDSNHVFLATRGNGVLTSTDGCQNWSPSTDGLDNLFVNAVALNPLNPDTIYAGTDGGIYVSFDGGMRWGEINQGLLGATVVYSIVIDLENNIYAATPYGIFQLEAD